MTLTQAAQLAVVANASVSLTLALATLARMVGQLGARLLLAIRHRRARPSRNPETREEGSKVEALPQAPPKASL